MDKEQLLVLVKDAMEHGNTPNLQDLDLSGIHLEKANLRGTNFCHSNLSGARLSYANLINCNFIDTNLTDTNFHHAVIRGSNLQRAKLIRANLWTADLHDTDLRGADLSFANLTHANLQGADLRQANLTEANYDFTTIGIHPAPEGDLIGWGKKNQRIVKLLIPAEAKRSCATTRKCRAEYAKVLAIYKIYVDDVYDIACIRHEPQRGPITRYTVGEFVYPDSWDEDRWIECGHGIHFFQSRREAEEWL